MVKKGEEGTTMMEKRGTPHYHKDNHLPLGFLNSKERMILKSTMNEREKKVDQIFIIHLVSDQEQIDLVVLEFEDHVMTWWHQLCMDNINQEPLATSWRDIKHLMRDRFFPSYYERENLLKLQRLQQGSICVDEYAKLMESLLLKVELQFESEEEKVARFVSSLWREIQDVVELHEYSTLYN